MNRRSFFRKIGVATVAGVGLVGGAVAATVADPKILHIAAGTADWTPSQEELQQLVTMFQAVDSDPLGGIVATRDGVTVTEIGVRGAARSICILDELAFYKV